MVINIFLLPKRKVLRLQLENWCLISYRRYNFCKWDVFTKKVSHWEYPLSDFFAVALTMWALTATSPLKGKRAVLNVSHKSWPPTDSQHLCMGHTRFFSSEFCFMAKLRLVKNLYKCNNLFPCVNEEFSLKRWSPWVEVLTIKTKTNEPLALHLSFNLETCSYASLNTHPSASAFR